MKRTFGLALISTALIFGILACESEMGKIKSLERQGEWGKAQEALKKAVEKRPNNPQLHNELGYVYNKRGYFDLANAEFTKAVQIDPFFVEAYYNRGALLYKIGQVDQAKTDFEKVISIDKNYASAYNNLALINQLFLSNNDEAMKNYRMAIDIEPDNAVYHRNLARLLKAMGDEKGAKEEDDRADILEAKTAKK